jgi:hypothetical protein
MLGEVFGNIDKISVVNGHPQKYSGIHLSTLVSWKSFWVLGTTMLGNG